MFMRVMEGCEQEQGPSASLPVVGLGFPFLTVGQYWKQSYRTAY